MRPKDETHDWAVLLPLALPPDLPPVILKEFGWEYGNGGRAVVVSGCVGDGRERKFDMGWANDR